MERSLDILLYRILGCKTYDCELHLCDIQYYVSLRTCILHNAIFSILVLNTRLYSIVCTAVWSWFMITEVRLVLLTSSMPLVRFSHGLSVIGGFCGLCAFRVCVELVQLWTLFSYLNKVTPSYHAASIRHFTYIMGCITARVQSLGSLKLGKIGWGLERAAPGDQVRMTAENFELWSH